MKTKTIAIIPARGGSKRLPNKNILHLDGLPLLAYSIQYAQLNAGIVDEIYVSTDDATIKKTALQFGAKVIDRPTAIAGDSEPTITTLQHALETLQDATIENIVLLQPTNPLRPESLLKESFQKFVDLKVDSLFTVSQNQHKLGKIVHGKYLPFNYEIGQRSQDLEPLYFENGLLYICKSKLVQEGKIISDEAFPYLVNHVFGAVDIDTKEDFDYAEFLIKKQK